MKSALKLRPKDVIVNRQAREWTAARFRRRAAELAEAERQEDRLRSWFQELDEDGSGEISAKELQDPMLILGLARSATDVFELVERLDTDGSAEISFDEVCLCYSQAPVVAPPLPPPEAACCGCGSSSSSSSLFSGTPPFVDR